MGDFCRGKSIKRESSVARTPQQNGAAERRNRTLIKAGLNKLATLITYHILAEAVSTACLYSLGKFDGKSDEGFFVRYSLSSKAFRAYNTRTRMVEENLHIRFLENKPMIEGNGPKWLFDIDSLTQSINYVLVTAGTISNDSAEQDKFADDSSPKDVNIAGQHVNTASPDVNTTSLKLNVVGPSVKTASSNEHDSPEDMFTMGVLDTVDLLKERRPLEHNGSSETSKMKVIVIARIEAIRLFLAYASFMGFLVYQMDDNGVAFYMEPMRRRLCYSSNHDLKILIHQQSFKCKALSGFHQAAKSMDGDADDVDVHLYISMIRSLMYLTISRPDIMFACKKQTVVATSTTKAEYVAAASCRGQVLWIQNQLLDYGYNFMSTVINIDNNNLLTKGFDAGRF
ncbi:ribonuclease H-like domain-containing protein [Tanacetum coccineum]